MGSLRNTNYLSYVDPRYDPPVITKKDEEKMGRSWWCEKCCVEVYERRCPHCGKTKREKA